MRYSLKKYREYECNKDIKIILFIYVFELTLIKDVKKKNKSNVKKERNIRYNLRKK